MTRTSHIGAQKELERQHLDAFRRVCRDFPIGEIVPGETPDFIIVGAARRIGVEHTLLLVDKRRKRASIQSYESAKNNITAAAERICLEKEPPEVYVGLFFNNSCKPRKRDEERIARAVAETVMRNLPSKGEHVWVRYELGSGQPIEVDLISIFHTTDFGREHWQWHEAGNVYRNAIEHLQRTIDGKTHTFQTCLAKCDECWLLIVAPSWTPAGFIYPDESSVKHAYTCSFQQTWFLDDFSETAVRLSTVGPETGKT